jgi:hypothetical protein
MSGRQPLLRLWAMPALLAALTFAGLLCALLGEARAWKALAWLALAVPLLVALRHAWPRGRRGTGGR